MCRLVETYIEAYIEILRGKKELNHRQARVNGRKKNILCTENTWGI